MKRIYLDYAAATPMSKEVLAAMKPYYSDQFYNPSAIYLSAIKVKKDMAAARVKIAAWLGARPAEIFFTAGATEANNLAIQGLMRRYPQGEILVGSVEHESVLMPAQLFNGRTIPVNEQGIIDTKSLEKLISPKVVLISVGMVNNELGIVQPIKEIATMLRQIREERYAAKNDLPIYLHTDAAQAANLFDLHTHRLGVDMMSLNGGKIYGPKQAGALFIRAGIDISPLIVGGGQENGLRSGTENVASIMGFSKALDLAQQMHAKEYKRLSELRQFFVDALEEFPSVKVNGAKRHQSPHIVNATFAGFDNERLMMQLDEAGIQVATGSACSASSDEPSHVLAAIGLDEDAARSTLRFSFGRTVTKADLERTIKALAQLLASN